MHSLWFIQVLQEEFCLKLQNALVETAEIEKETEGEKEMVRESQKERKKGIHKRE